METEGGEQNTEEGAADRTADPTDHPLLLILPLPPVMLAEANLLRSQFSEKQVTLSSLKKAQASQKPNSV